MLIQWFKVYNGFCIYFSEQLFMETADLLVSEGFAKAGYNLIIGRLLVGENEGPRLATVDCDAIQFVSRSAFEHLRMM